MDEAQSITGDVVCRMFFGKDFTKETFAGLPMTKGITMMFEKMTWQLLLNPLALIFGVKVLDYSPLPHDRRTNKMIKDFRELCRKTVEERKLNIDKTFEGQSSDRKDLMQILLEKNRDGKPEDHLSDEELYSLFMTMFMAGMDTTGHLIAMAVYNMCAHSNVKSKAEEEVSKVIKNYKEIGEDEIKELKYIDALCLETLRLHAPLQNLFPREATVDHELGPLKIKKGTIVNVRLNRVGFSDEVPDVDEFRPERWLSGEMERHHNFSWVPFSAGPRNCIGQHLAMREAKIILAIFLKRFDFRLSDKFKPGFALRFFFETQSPLNLVITPRA
jgi:cytochrome P450 family 4 subfamily V